MVTKRNPDVTRENLLNAAFQEFYQHGFQAASLDRIIEAAGVTKGALYHHFPNKKELGYAVCDEIINPGIVEQWIEPLQRTDDPIGVMLARMAEKLKALTLEEVSLGCPLNNLSLEMSPHDDGFRERTVKMYDMWKNAMGQALARGQGAGTVARSIDPTATAGLIVAAIEGSIDIAKNAQSLDVMKQQMAGLRGFLESIHLTKVVS